MTYPDQDFRVGDKVYLLHKDVWGIVSHIGHDRFRIRVDFEFNGYNDYDYFDVRGFYSDDNGIPFLYHGKVDISEAPKRKFSPTLIGKTLVITHTMRGQAKRILIGKVESETETAIKIENRVEITKSSIKSIHDLGEEIKL